MGKPAGLPKSGGRKKGSRNKVSGSMRIWLTDLIEDNRGQIEKDLKELEPKDRLQMLEKLMSYTLPKLSSVDAKIDLNELSDQQLETIINEITKDL